jgi:hypothetical protein
MSYNQKIHSLNIGIQKSLLLNEYSQFHVKTTSPKTLKCVGSLQPTSRSTTYNFEMRYKIGYRPKIVIEKPELVKNFKGERIPHTFSWNEPCLYYKNDFNSSKPIAKTIIPWLSLWLYFYEDWHITGIWNGGGIPHPTSKRKY